ncbi:MAG: stage II sporulation protein R [Clostridia bacterium]
MKSFFKKYNLPFLICTFSIIILSTYISLKLYNQNKLSNEAFRLHVVANSNDINDQILKLKVSNKIELYITDIIKNCNNKQAIYIKISENINQILNIANTELRKNNIDYSCKIKLGKINYEEKENIYIKMDKSAYDSVQILLGNANGNNYWNLIFPDKKNIQNLSSLENILPNISKLYENNQIIEEKEYTFKVIEIFNNLLNLV